ncbi:hypothetical protein L249_7561, partial [Ophiocordyceps polyrhachis-furcata BCC 54312]
MFFPSPPCLGRRPEAGGEWQFSRECFAHGSASTFECRSCVCDGEKRVSADVSVLIVISKCSVLFRQHNLSLSGHFKTCGIVPPKLEAALLYPVKSTSFVLLLPSALVKKPKSLGGVRPAALVTALAGCRLEKALQHPSLLDRVPDCHGDRVV